MTPPADPRAPLLAVAAWAGGLVAALVPVPVVVGLLAAAAVVGLLAWRSRAWTVTGTLLAAGTVAAVALLHAAGGHDGPVDELATERAVVSVDVTTTSDPRPARTAYGLSLIHI